MDNLNWAAVIPAKFLIAKDIGSTQKLLLGLISSLSNLKGYCFASNEYLSNLLDLSKVTISQSISDLEAKGYLKRIIHRNDKQQVEERILIINLDNFSNIPPLKKHNPLPLKTIIPPLENLKDNNKNNINYNNNIIELNFPSLEWMDLWKEWVEYKITEHKDKFKTKKTEQLAIDNLLKISNSRIDIAKKIVSRSIINRWKGLFEIKEEKKDKLEQYQDWLEDTKNYLNARNNTSEADNEIKRLSL